jgi:hypothetical protein
MWLLRPYLLQLIERLADRSHAASSAESISWAAHREAEKLADITMVDELAGAARSDASKHRRAACYFVIGKIGRNLQDARCASVLLGLLAAEKDKHNIAALLERIGETPKRAELDLDTVYALSRGWPLAYPPCGNSCSRQHCEPGSRKLATEARLSFSILSSSGCRS